MNQPESSGLYRIKAWWQQAGPVQTRILPSLLNFALFALITIALHFLWWDVFVRPLSATGIYDGITGFLIRMVVFPSFAFVDGVLGYDVRLEGSTLLFGDWGYIAVVESCAGLKQFYQVFFLILLFRGSWKHKAWFIPLAILSLYGVNVFRIIGLSVVLENWPQHWDFIHSWVFRPFYYVVIFGFWVWWMERFGGAWGFGLGTGSKS